MLKAPFFPHCSPRASILAEKTAKIAIFANRYLSASCDFGRLNGDFVCLRLGPFGVAIRVESHRDMGVIALRSCSNHGAITPISRCEKAFIAKRRDKRRIANSILRFSEDDFVAFPAQKNVKMEMAFVKLL